MKEPDVALFQKREIRRTMHNDEWWFVITDVIAALTDSADPSDYWKKMRKRDPDLSKDLQGGGQFVPPLAFEFTTAGGPQKLQCWNTEGVFRLIQSIPSPKAEPFKRWLARLGKERIDEIENPELTMGRMQELYEKKGYPKEWIDKRLRGIAVRLDLTDEWKNRGAATSVEFAVLTNEIMQKTFDLKVDEWVERLSAFLNMKTTGIGQIGGGRNRPNRLLDVALVQSLVRKGVVDDRVGDYGQLIVDECHHLSAHSFEQVARRAKARFMAGLSATVARKDGHHPIIFMQCGPVRHRVNAKSQAASRPFEHTVLVCPTAFQSHASTGPDTRIEFQTLYKELVESEARNQRICDDVVQSVREGRSPLVLTERNEHLDRIAIGLSSHVPHHVVLRGGMGRKQRKAAADQLTAIPRDEGRVILATGRYVGEGFDDPRLDTLFVTLPVSWRGTIAQYAGRLHRNYDGKREVRIHDYADLNVPMLARMFNRRCSGYEAVGYTIVLPASAVPGWPADVPLPADPLWKRDFAGSVRRLVRDGVDSPLASLFVNAARHIPPEIDGAKRARSATEAFLYRRLETLPETRGCFRLNADLPIAFDSCGRMEVDLLCDESRLVVEIDGPQHLADPVAYRRDRRKDQLLQENGYLVLRFLAEDVARELDAVLDGILRSLSHRRTTALDQRSPRGLALASTLDRAAEIQAARCRNPL